MRHTTLASILTFSAACTAQADLLPAIEWEFASEEWNIAWRSNRTSRRNCAWFQRWTPTPTTAMEMTLPITSRRM